MGAPLSIPGLREARLLVRPPEAAAIGVVYFAYFGALGVFGPFLALYLAHRGLSTAQVAFLLALLPLTQVIATPAWSLLADRVRSAALVLRIVAIGSLTSFAFLAMPLGLVPLAMVLVVFTVFRAPAGSLTDVMGLDWASRTGGDFGRLRAWGTVGYTLAALATAMLVQRAGPAAIVPGALVLFALVALCALRMPRVAPPPKASLASGLKALAHRPRLLLFLGVASLQQVGNAPYDMLFPAYLSSLSSPDFAGMAIALGTLSEVLVMTHAARLLRKLGTERAIVLAFTISIVRWSVVAATARPLLLVAVQALHGITFGLFYIAAVTIVREESPPDVRASAQGIFSAVYSGIAVSASLAAAGVVQRWGGLPTVFATGAFASGVAALMALRSLRAPAPAPAPEAGGPQPAA